MATTARKSGRPTKKEVAQREAQMRRAEEARVGAILEELPPIWKCTRCSTLVQRPEGRFFAVNTNDAYSGNAGRTNLCIACSRKYFDEYSERFKDEKLALMLTCAQMGSYFSEPLYATMKDAEAEDPEKNAFDLGKYVRSLNGQQYKGKNFISYMTELYSKQQTFTSDEELRERGEELWKASDRKNKASCIKDIGYDCFNDPAYTDSDRRFLFNLLASYLLTGDVADDRNKVQAIIEIVKTSLQMEFVNRQINQESRKSALDQEAISKLVNIKSQLQNLLNKTAKENALSASSSGQRGKSSTAFTAVMKEMIDNGVLEAKVNLTEVKMTEAFQAIADISTRALINEMNITGDEYAALVGKQIQTIKSQNEKIMKLEEDLRLMTIRAHEAEAKKKRYSVNIVELEMGGVAQESDGESQ